MTVLNGGIVRVACRLYYGQDDIVNVFHLMVLQDTSNADVMTGVGEWAEEFYSPIEGVLHQGVGFGDIKIDEVEWLAGKEVIVQNIGIIGWPTLTTGTASGDPLPSAVSALITLRTAGVRTLGRKFIGRSVEGLHDASGWVSAAVTSLANAADVMLSGFADSNTNQWTPVVHSLRAGDWLTFISYVIRNVAAYQRRRKPGVGS